MALGRAGGGRRPFRHLVNMLMFHRFHLSPGEFDNHLYHPDQLRVTIFLISTYLTYSECGLVDLG